LSCNIVAYQLDYAVKSVGCQQNQTTDISWVIPQLDYESKRIRNVTHFRIFFFILILTAKISKTGLTLFLRNLELHIMRNWW